MITKRDYLFAAITGFFTGIFISLLLWIWSVGSLLITLLIVLGIPILWMAGIWLGGWLGRHVRPFFAQFAKFAVVGFLSASIDFAVLNTVSVLTGITTGLVLGWINVPGFMIAVVNGYVWNKLWVFHEGEHTLPLSFMAHLARLFSDFPKFLAVTVSGLLSNSAVVVVIATYIPAPVGPVAWLNIAKVIASAMAMCWNFIGYKFFAFVGIRPSTSHKETPH